MIAQQVRIAEVVTHPNAELQLLHQYGDTAAARQTVPPPVVADHFEIIFSPPRTFGLLRRYRRTLFVDECRGDVVGEKDRRIEIDAHPVFEQVDVRLPDDRQHQRLDAARVPLVFGRVLFGRILKKRESPLQIFEIDAETAYETLGSVIAPRYARRVASPDHPGFLFGIEPGIAVAVTARYAQRMLCRRCAAAQHRSEEQAYHS